MKKRLFLLTILLHWLFLIGLNGQVSTDSTDVWRVVLNDGNEYYGNILEEADTYIIMETTNLGELKIPLKQIKVKEKLGEARIKNGEVWLQNLQATRYFWAPNGYGLEKGEGYYQNVWVLFNQGSYGITDYFSVGAGLVPLFLFNGAPTPVFIVPKFSFPIVKNKINAGVGVIAGIILSSDDFVDTEGPFGIAYGVVSGGNKDRNINVGVGMAFAEGELANSPVVSLGGMIRVSKKTYLLTENYFFRSSDFSFGLIAIGG